MRGRWRWRWRLRRAGQASEGEGGRLEAGGRGTGLIGLRQGPFLLLSRLWCLGVDCQLELGPRRVDLAIAGEGSWPGELWSGEGLGLSSSTGDLLLAAMSGSVDLCMNASIREVFVLSGMIFSA